MNTFQPSSIESSLQRARPTAAKVFTHIPFWSGIVIAFTWLIVLFFLQKPIASVPSIIFELKILFLPLISAFWIFIILPFSLILRALFLSSEERTVSSNSTALRSIALLCGLLMSYNMVTTTLYLLESMQEITAVLPMVTHLVVGFLFLVTALLLWLFIALWNGQRWTKLTTVFLTAGLLTAATLQLLHQLTPPLNSFADILATIILILFFGTATYILVRSRTSFTGPPRKLWVQVPLLLFFCLTVGVSVASQLYFDDISINDADLILPEVAILPESENVHTYLPTDETMSATEAASLEQATEYVRSLQDGQLTLDQAKTAVLGTEHLVEAVIEASTKPAYQCPTSVNKYSSQTVLCRLNSQRNLAILTVLHSKIATLEGDHERAIQLSLATLRLGKIMEESQQTDLIEYLVSSAIHTVGLEGLQFWVDNAQNAPKDQLTTLQDTLPEYQRDSGPVLDALRSEYMSLKDTFLTGIFEAYGVSAEDININPSKASYSYLPNKTVNHFADFFRLQISKAAIQCTTDTSHLERQIESELALLSAKATVGWNVLAPNAVGNIMMAMTLASLNDLDNIPCEFNRELESLHLEIDELLAQ